MIRYSGQQQRQQRRSAGFTLIELVVSLAILSVLSLLVFARSSQQVQAARVSQFVEQLRMLDSLARVSARRSNESVSLNFQPRQRRIEKRSAEKRAREQIYTVPTAVREMRVRTTGRNWSASPTEIPFGLLGRSSNYAIRLTLRSGTVRYVAIVGASGQALVTSDESAVDALFQ